LDAIQPGAICAGELNGVALYEKQAHRMRGCVNDFMLGEGQAIWSRGVLCTIAKPIPETARTRLGFRSIRPAMLDESAKVEKL